MTDRNNPFVDTSVVTIDDTDYGKNPLFKVDFLKNQLYNKKLSFYCSNNMIDKDFDDTSYARYPLDTGEYIEI